VTDQPTPQNYLQAASLQANMMVRATVSRIVESSTSPHFLPTLTEPKDGGEPAFATILQALEDALTAVQVSRNIYLAARSLAQQPSNFPDHEGLQVAGSPEVGS